MRTWQDLAREKSMVFLVGPRQVGKTTLAQIISNSYTNNLYFNWDVPPHRARLIENPFFFEELTRKDPSRPLIIFDEIHKYKDWKNYLKGIYDEFHLQYQFLVSGSGRLDIYQKGETPLLVATSSFICGLLRSPNWETPAKRSRFFLRTLSVFLWQEVRIFGRNGSVFPH